MAEATRLIGLVGPLFSGWYGVPVQDFYEVQSEVICHEFKVLKTIRLVIAQTWLPEYLRVCLNAASHIHARLWHHAAASNPKFLYPSNRFALNQSSNASSFNSTLKNPSQAANTLMAFGGQYRLPLFLISSSCS